MHDVQSASFVVDDGKRRRDGTDGLERLVEKRRRHLCGGQRTGERGGQRLEPACSAAGELGLQPGVALSFVQARALEGLRRVTGDDLDEPPSALVGSAVGPVAGDEQPDGVVLDDERDDREHAVGLLAPDGRVRHAGVVRPRVRHAGPVPGACGVGGERGERDEVAVGAHVVDDGGLRAGDRLHALRHERGNLGGSRRGPERRRDRMELREVTGKPLGSRAGDLLGRLGTTTLALLDHEAGVVGEPANEREQLGRRIGHDPRPAKREEQLGAPRHDEGHAQH